MDTKTCGKCKATKALNLFNKRTASEDGLQNECKGCNGISSRGWRLANPEKAATNSRAWVKADPKRAREYKKRWDRGHPEKLTAKNALRRASKLRATPTWADQDKIKVIYKAAAHHKGLTKELVAVDHIVPLQSKLVCGLHVHNNLRIVVGTFNSRKGNYTWPDMPSDKKSKRDLLNK